MQRPLKAKKSKKGQALTQPVKSRRGEMELLAWVIGIFVIGLGLGIYMMTAHTARHLDITINKWRTDYHLTPAQAEQVRSIERSFHGSGNPFAIPSHTPDEIRVHHQEIAAVMNPEDGKRFLKSQGRH